MQTYAAPRLSASSPTEPEPQKRSSTRTPGRMGVRMLKRASRTRSWVGRTSPLGTSRGTPPALPATIFMRKNLVCYQCGIFFASYLFYLLKRTGAYHARRRGLPFAKFIPCSGTLTLPGLAYVSARGGHREPQQVGPVGEGVARHCDAFVENVGQVHVLAVR